MSKIPYSRILLKVSGEALAGTEPYGIDARACQWVITATRDLLEHGIEVGIVIGGGNIFRGVKGSELGITQTAADAMGMLATNINAIALDEGFRKAGIKSLVLSAIVGPPIAEPYAPRKAIKALERKEVVLFAGGTGNPYFTTDTAAVLRACEIGAGAVLKGTKVGGVYSKDPVRYPEATRFERISYKTVLSEGLGIMDATAIALAESRHLPIYVFDLAATTKLTEIFTNTGMATIIC